MDLVNSLRLPNGERCSRFSGELVNKPMSSQDRSLAVDHMSSGQQSLGEDIRPPPSAQPHQDGKENKPTLTYGLMDIGQWDQETSFDPTAVKRKLVPIQSKGNSEAITQFHKRCQAEGFQPVFDFPEVAKGSFTAKVVFGTINEQIEDAFPSKQAAKIAICKQALKRLPVVEIGTKRKAEYTDVSTPQLDKSENWIGILLGMCMTTQSFIISSFVTQK